MDNLLIKKTEKTPYISLEKGLMQFRGRSVIEDAKRIFKPVIDWIVTYQPTDDIITTVNFDFEYLSTSSSKYIFDILKLLDDLYAKGHDIVIYWYYDEGDHDILDLGLHLKSFIKAPFNFIENEQGISQLEDFMNES